MQRLIFAALLSTAVTPAFAADVGVSISVGQPGFYGQIDIGNYPRPVLVNPRPVIIERVRIASQPIYLVAPPGHIKHWEKHCHEYRACGRPVYFVDERWYLETYVPQYREQEEGPGRHHGKKHDHDKGHGRGH